MKAAQINGYGGPDVIEVNEINKPAPREGQVLIKVHASSINPFDAKLKAGYMKDGIPLQFPFTLGGDVAGEVVGTGPGVTGLAAGDKVYGQAAGVAGNSGALAEFAATTAEHVAKAPSNLDYKQAASLPLVGVSALQALTEHIRLQPGQKIFIRGGAGGIGTIAIQIAKSIGAHVATTVSAEHIQLAKELGADNVIDYKEQDFTALLHGYDAVFDLAGGAGFTQSLAVLKKGGIAVSMIAHADEAKAAELGVTAVTQATKVNTARLDKLRELIEAGTIKPQVDQVFPLAQVREAFAALENGTVKGKVVVEIAA